MKRRIITAAVVLGLGAMTFAMAQQGTDTSKVPSTCTVAAPDQARAGGPTDPAGLHDRVARLRAEVELLELEHDATRVLLSERLKAVVVADADTIGEIDEFRIVSFYMKMGAEKVGKAAEFDKAIAQDRAAMEKAIASAREIPTELGRKKAEFLRLGIELNRKKIELVELETKLEGSM